MGFPFLFAVCAAAMIAIAFVDVEKGRVDGRKFVETHRGIAGRAQTGVAESQAGGKGTPVRTTERVAQVGSGRSSDIERDE